MRSLLGLITRPCDSCPITGLLSLFRICTAALLGTNPLFIQSEPHVDDLSYVGTMSVVYNALLHNPAIGALSLRLSAPSHSLLNAG